MRYPAGVTQPQKRIIVRGEIAYQTRFRSSAIETPAGTVQLVDDWLGHTGGAIGMDRRFFLAVSGGALTASAWAYADHLGTRGGSFARWLTAGAP